MADGNHHRPTLGSLVRVSTSDAERLRKSQTFNLLDKIGQSLEPTPTQMERAKTAYEAVAEWLAGDPLLEGASIYVQGSAAHGTMVKPILSNEHDVDLICKVVGYGPQLPPAVLKRLVGERLRAHGTYARMLEEKPRCWRLNQSGEFHLDITPSIPNPECANGGELVPDKKMSGWKPSNPCGFRDLFARRAALKPVRSVAKAFDGSFRADADVQPFSVDHNGRGVLRRTVQVSKRHRDLYFADDCELAPLSIIITSLAARAYEYCVRNYPYDNELDLVCDTVRAMPWFIEEVFRPGRPEWLVINETTDGENFAEKWADKPALADAFYRWHPKALSDFEAVAAAVGLDRIERALSTSLGEEPVRKAFESLTNNIGGARRSGALAVAPAVGLATAARAAQSTAVRSNTFFGSRP